MIRKIWSVTVVAALVTLTACDGTAGPEGDGEARVLMSRSTSGPSASLLGNGAPGEVGSAGISLESVSSIEVTVDRVELHRADAEEVEGEGADGPPWEGEAPGGWISLDVEETSLDLLALPVEGGVEIATGDVEAGVYDKARLFVSSATITLDEQVQIGAAATLEPGEYDLFIPSAEQTGIKVDLADFEVVTDGSGAVVLEFEAGSSVQTVTWTANGLLMSPVLTAGGDAGVESGL